MASRLTGNNSDALHRWNKTCMQVVDLCTELRLHPQDKGKDTETLAGLQITAQLIVAEATIVRQQQQIKHLTQSIVDSCCSRR